jgi:ABC-2 type transport system permease protein
MKLLALASQTIKRYLVFRLWFWIGLLLNTIFMAVQVFFWRAVYTEVDQIAGIVLGQTLTYILFTSVFGGLGNTDVLWEIGYLQRNGDMAQALLRPYDLQLGHLAEDLGGLVMGLLFGLPLALLATVLFGLAWPTDPVRWLAFGLTGLLGHIVIYFLFYGLACLTFYTTEVWGLGVLLGGVQMFFSGALIPLAMLPGWMQGIAFSLPFAQAVYQPLAVLSGITPLDQVPWVIAGQMLWLIGLGLGSRLLFGVAVRKVTIQGG